MARIVRGRVPVHWLAALLALLSLCCLAPLASARFYYKDFRDTSHLRLVGSARPTAQSSQRCVALTGGGKVKAGNETGGMWYARTIDLRTDAPQGAQAGSDGFMTSFHFSLTPSSAPVNLTQRALDRAARAAIQPPLPVVDAGRAPSPSSSSSPAKEDEELLSSATAELPPGGDGFAFVFRRAPPSGDVAAEVGRGGSGLGYAELEGEGLVIEFDTRMDLAERDPSANHVSVRVNDGKLRGQRFSSFEGDDSRAATLSMQSMPLRRPRVLSSSNAASVAVASAALRKRLSEASAAPIVVQVSYLPHVRKLRVWVGDLVSPVLELREVPVFTGRFQAGFTAATSGESADVQSVCQWYFERRRAVARGGGGEAGSGAPAVAPGAASSKAGSSKGTKGVPIPSPSSGGVEVDACDPGFKGPSCSLDLSDYASGCLVASRGGCGACVRHDSGHCIWCASQQRCISSEVAGTFMDKNQHKPYCSDPTSIVEDADQCPEAPSYVLLGSCGVLLVVVVCTLISLTGNLWIKSKRNQTLGRDIARLLGYTMLGSMFSISMTSVANMVMAEVTLSSDQSAPIALGIFLLLFAALLLRDVHHARARGGGSKRGGLIAAINYDSIMNPDDSAAASAILHSLEANRAQQRASPGSPRAGSLLSRNGGSATEVASSAYHSALRLVRTPTFLPLVYACEIILSSLLCFLLLTPEWSHHYDTRQRTAIYAALATALLFTLAYLFVTLWRMAKSVAGAMWGDLIPCFGNQASKPSSLRSRRVDVWRVLSAFASSSLLHSVIQIRILSFTTLISGVYFGHMFGGLDAADASKSHIDLFIQRENYYSYPLAACLGAMSAFANQYLDMAKQADEAEALQAHAASQHI